MFLDGVVWPSGQRRVSGRGAEGGRPTRPSPPYLCSLQPKTYVQGTSADQTSTGLNGIIAAGAAVLAVAALASGLFAIGGPTGIDSVAPPAELKSLSQYSSEFSG